MFPRRPQRDAVEVAVVGSSFILILVMLAIVLQLSIFRCLKKFRSFEYKSTYGNRHWASAALAPNWRGDYSQSQILSFRFPRDGATSWLGIGAYTQGFLLWVIMADAIAFSLFRYDPFEGIAISSTENYEVFLDRAVPDDLSLPDAVFIHGGRFIMGDCGDDGYGYDSPCKEVVVGDLYVAKYEVTIREYRQCVDYGYCRELPFRILGDDSHIDLSSDDQLPAFGLTWVDAQKYASWLAALTDTAWRLPSEAEWEYFARAGSSSVYYWGDNENCDMVASKAFSLLCGDIVTGPMSVGSREPNAWGLYDVLGSASEYTLDCWYYPYDSLHNTAEPIVSGDCSKRVKRGGGWSNSTSLRIRSRWGMPIERSQVDDGLRLVRDAN